MTLEWHDDGSGDDGGPSRRVGLSSPGRNCRSLAATPRPSSAERQSAAGLRLPAPLRVVISHAEKSFVFRLVAIRGSPPQSGPTRRASQSWRRARRLDGSGQRFHAGIEPTLGRSYRGGADRIFRRRRNPPGRRRTDRTSGRSRIARRPPCSPALPRRDRRQASSTALLRADANASVDFDRPRAGPVAGQRPDRLPDREAAPRRRRTALRGRRSARAAT